MRMLIEMDVPGRIAETMAFGDDTRELSIEEVAFEWKPLKCDFCLMFRDIIQDCMERVGKVWFSQEPQQLISNPLINESNTPIVIKNGQVLGINN